MNDRCANHASLRLLAPTFLVQRVCMILNRIQKRQKKTAGWIKSDGSTSDDGVGSEGQNKIAEIWQNGFFFFDSTRSKRG